MSKAIFKVLLLFLIGLSLTLPSCTRRTQPGEETTSSSPETSQVEPPLSPDPAAETSPAPETNISHIVYLSRLDDPDEKAALVYILPHEENATGYTGLAIFLLESGQEEPSFELGKSYRATTNGVMTRSIPPQFSGRIESVDREALPALEMSWGDYLVYSSLASSAQLYDVRTSSEFEAGHVHEAHHLSLQDIEAGERGDLSKEQPLFLYCRSGARSGQAAEILAKEGYLPVFNLGGIREYPGKVTTD